MEISSDLFFTSEIITNSRTITLIPSELFFYAGNEIFDYNFEEKQFEGNMLEKEYYANHIKNLISYFTQNDIKYSRSSALIWNSDNDYSSDDDSDVDDEYDVEYEFKIKCDNPMLFLESLKRDFTDVKNLEIDVNMYYESPTFYNNIPYKKDFFIQNVKTLYLPNHYYCYICLEQKNEDGNDIEIKVKGLLVKIICNFANNAVLLDEIKNIDYSFSIIFDKYLTWGDGSFTVSRPNEDDISKRIDNNKINDILNILFRHYPKLEIKYIKIRFNDVD